MEDIRIIELYFDRDEAAIKETAAKYGHYCHAIANRILCSDADAEECVNDTYLNTWNAIPPTRPQRLRLFLAKIVRNLAFNRYKAQHRDKRGGGELASALSEMEEFLADTTEIDEEVRLAALKESLSCFLLQLSPQERGIFLRRYFFVESAGEIGRRFDLGDATVRAILSRTRKKLKTHLEKEGFTV